MAMDTWTDERVEELKGLATTMTASQIEKHWAGTITRNAIIGKMHRLRLSQTASEAGRQNAMARKAKRARAKAEERAKARAEAKAKKLAGTRLGTVKLLEADTSATEAIRTGPDNLEPLAESILDLEDNECRWFRGEVHEGCCGRPTVGKLPYCEDHARRAYTAEGAKAYRGPGITLYRIPGTGL